jgi:hypothetical protein
MKEREEFLKFLDYFIFKRDEKHYFALGGMGSQYQDDTDMLRRIRKEIAMHQDPVNQDPADARGKGTLFMDAMVKNAMQIYAADELPLEYVWPDRMRRVLEYFLKRISLVIGDA